MSTALTNTSFETAGPLRGLAEAWHRHGWRNGRMVAGFATRAVDPLPDASAFDAASWAPVEVGVSGDVFDAPDDTGEADFIEETAVTDYHALSTTDPVVLAEGATFTIGVYLHEGDDTFGGIGVLTSGGYVSAIFDLANAGRIKTYPVAAGEIEKVHASATFTPNRWIRVALTFELNAELTASPAIFLSKDGTADPYAGTAGEGIYAWGAFIHGGDLRDAESFGEGWLGGENVSSVIVLGETCLFATGLLDPVSRDEEDFEIGWNNHPLLFTIALAGEAIFDTGDLLNNHVEPFDNGWNGNAFGSFFPTIETGDQASFAGSGTSEAFSRNWSSNETFSTTITVSEAALFDGDLIHIGSEPYEDFEETYADVPFEVGVLATSTLAADHDFPDGTPVFARVSTNGHLPAGLNGIQRYYVRDAVAGVSLRLSLTSGGAAVTITDVGEGTFTLRADPLYFWSGDDVGDP